MKPKKKSTNQSNFLHPWLDFILDHSHELYQLANHVDWNALEEEFSKLFTEGKGAPAKPVRLVVGIMMLQHMYDFSDEGAIDQWIENPYWQYFCGEEQLQLKQPLSPSSLPKWRKRLGEEGMNMILSESIKTALKTGTVKASSLKKAIVDSTVMEKNITYPTDSKTRCKAIEFLVDIAKRHNIPLRQSFIRVANHAQVKGGRYAHARQMKRAHKEWEKIKTYLGRLYRDIQRKIADNPILQSSYAEKFELVERLLAQTKDSKDKVFSFHEPHVECISKGKAHKKFEFGCKASFVITHKEGLALGAAALHGNPFDGHTLKKALFDAEKNSSKKIDTAFVDKGYKGHKIKDQKILISGQKKGVTKWFRKQLKRRQAVEPHIGHMKNDGKLGRNFLKGILGDLLNAVLCGIGHNLRMIVRRLRLTAALP